MNNQKRLPLELANLRDQVAMVDMSAEDRQRVNAAIDGVIKAGDRRRRILTLVQDALSQLRLDMKYLMFDVEATRRERDELRQKLDSHKGQG